MIHARHPRSQAEVSPMFADWSVREKLRGDSVCVCRLHGTGNGVYGREIACSCVSAWILSALLWFSEKTELRSSPQQIHTCCPHIGFESKISSPKCSMLLKTLRSGEALVSEQSSVWFTVTCQRSTQRHRGSTPLSPYVRVLTEICYLTARLRSLGGGQHCGPAMIFIFVMVWMAFVWQPSH